jgi:hypothetical protein
MEGQRSFPRHKLENDSDFALGFAQLLQLRIMLLRLVFRLGQSHHNAVIQQILYRHVPLSTPSLALFGSTRPVGHLYAPPSVLLESPHYLESLNTTKLKLMIQIEVNDSNP